MRLARVIQKIFGLTAPAEEFGQIGSFASGTPFKTKNIADMQALNEYLGGWNECVSGGNAPTIEDMNSLFHMITHQLAYNLQMGIPEWSDSAEYFIGSLVNDGTGRIFKSLTDSNRNNALTEDAFWAEVGGAGEIEDGSVTPEKLQVQMFVARPTQTQAVAASSFFVNMRLNNILKNNIGATLAESEDVVNIGKTGWYEITFTFSASRIGSSGGDLSLSIIHGASGSAGSVQTKHPIKDTSIPQGTLTYKKILNATDYIRATVSTGTRAVNIRHMESSLNIQYLGED